MSQTKRTALIGTALALSYVFSAQAIVIGGTDVGALDNLLCSVDSPDSGQAYEESFIQSCTGNAVSLAQNIDINNEGLLSEGIYSAINAAPNTPGYFLLKFGTGNTGRDMLVFENLANFSFLVWSDTQLLTAGISERHLNSISHYTFGGVTSVPEPTTLSLLGAGLLAVAAARRRRKA